MALFDVYKFPNLDFNSSLKLARANAMKRESTMMRYRLHLL